MTIFDRRILGLSAVLAGSLAWTVAWSQSQQVDVEIVNRAFQAIDVEVYDWFANRPSTRARSSTTPRSWSRPARTRTGSRP